jgi:hypothetical protein
VLYYGLCSTREVPQIGEAYAIDAGRQTPLPAAPDQPADVEQYWGVVTHRIRLN